MTSRHILVAGNWKMNGVLADVEEITAVRNGCDGLAETVKVLLCPPATLLCKAVEHVAGSRLTIGAQDCHPTNSGAFTGDISALMIKDVGASHVITGHSERRRDHGETSRMVRLKAEAALRAGLDTIICIGETAGERAAGLVEAVCARQLRESLPTGAPLSRVIIAYEPVWAIGRGVTPQKTEIAHVHRMVKQHLRHLCEVNEKEQPRVLYGGSVTPENAPDIFDIAEVDGVLVGGASLKAASFLSIVAAANKVIVAAANKVASQSAVS